MLDLQQTYGVANTEMEVAMKKIDIVVPCFNEEEGLQVFYDVVSGVVKEIKDYEWNFIFVDDGSKDKTPEIMRRLADTDDSVKYIIFSRNFGKEAAMFAGFEQSDGDYVVVMDSDLQDDPDMLSQMVAAMEEGYDCCATRRMDRKGEPPIRSWFARRFYALMNRFTEVEMMDGARDYRMMTRQMVDAILRVSERERFSKGIFAWVGFDYKWLEYKNRERTLGSTKWSFWKLFKYAIDGIIAFSTAPLKALMLIGGSISAGSLIFMIYKIIKTLVEGVDVPGYASLVVIMLFLGGLNLFAVGLVGLYVGNVYTEAKGRPIYVQKESNIE